MNTYWKILVVELDPFCESKVIYDKNISFDEKETAINQIAELYPDDDKYVIVFKEMAKLLV